MTISFEVIAADINIALQKNIIELQSAKAAQARFKAGNGMTPLRNIHYSGGKRIYTLLLFLYLNLTLAVEVNHNEKLINNMTL